MHYEKNIRAVLDAFTAAEAKLDAIDKSVSEALAALMTETLNDSAANVNARPLANPTIDATMTVVAIRNALQYSRKAKDQLLALFGAEALKAKDMARVEDEAKKAQTEDGAK